MPATKYQPTNAEQLAEQLAEVELALKDPGITPLVKSALLAQAATLRKKMTSAKNRKATSGDGIEFAAGDTVYVYEYSRYGGGVATCFRVNRLKKEPVCPVIEEVTVTRISPQLDKVQFMAGKGEYELSPKRVFSTPAAAHAGAYYTLAQKLAYQANALAKERERFHSMSADMVTFDRWAQSNGVENVAELMAEAMQDYGLDESGLPKSE